MPHTTPGVPMGAFVRNENLFAAELGPELAMLNVERGRYYVFSGTARQIWNMLGEPVRFGDLRQRLLDRYDIDEESCERDLLELLDQLIEEGLVRVQ